MGDKTEITAAIAAHGQWKIRIRNAIGTGQSEYTPQTIQADNQCVFGKWFYSLPISQRDSESGRLVKDLHAKFHREAARILEMAITGRKVEAENAMSLSGDYSRLSAELTRAIISWGATF